MKVVKVGINQYIVTGILQLSFDNYWKAKAYLYGLL